MTVSDEVLQLIEAAAQAAVQRALGQLRVPVVTHGTVVDADTTGRGLHEVIVDGDDESSPIRDVTTGATIVDGDRVTVLFAPPHQALIIGRLRPS